jgi:DNA-binding LacI/PurR family transcriptional regulator
MNPVSSETQEFSVTARVGSSRMKDVADRAGVSLMTVSLVLRDGETPRVSLETRTRVLQAAKELCYVPNARAQGLRSGVTNVIGLYAGYGFVNVRTPFFTEIVSGLQEGCELYDKDLLLHGTFRNRSVEEIYNELRDGRIDGLIVNMPATDPLAHRLAEAHFPVVAVGDALPGLPSVVVDDEGGGRLIAKHLLEKGHTRCIYVRGNVEAVSAERRRVAFVQYALQNGLKVQQERLSITSPSHANEDLIDYWQALAPHRRPRAFVFWNDTSAYHFLEFCRMKGLRVPEDMAVIGFDGCPMPYNDFWLLTTVRAPWANAAQTAVERLNALLQGKSVPMETILPVELITGRTS